MWDDVFVVEWRDYAPLPPVAITIGPARKRPREEPAGCVAAPCLPTMMVARSLPNHSTKLIAKHRAQWRRPGQGCALRQGLARRQRPHFLQCQRCLLCLLQCRLLQGRQPRMPWA